MGSKGFRDENDGDVCGAIDVRDRENADARLRLVTSMSNCMISIPPVVLCFY